MENKSNFKKEIGERVRDLRKNLGYSQQEIAKKLRLHRPSISQIEHGERELSAEELNKLSEIFGLSMDEIITVRPKKQESAAAKNMPPGDIRLTFLRHGEAVDDIYEQYGGWANPDLSPKGINKAYVVSQGFQKRNLSFDIIYTSPLARARQLAEVLGRELRIDVKILQYLKERNTYGLLCGINKKVARKKFPDLVDAYESGKYVLASERYNDFVDRLPLIFSYVKKSGHKNICCVTHGKLITGIIKHMLKMKPDSLDEGCMLVLGLDKKGMYYIQSEGITFAK